MSLWVCISTACENSLVCSTHGLISIEFQVKRLQQGKPVKTPKSFPYGTEENDVQYSLQGSAVLMHFGEENL